MKNAPTPPEDFFFNSHKPKTPAKHLPVRRRMIEEKQRKADVLTTTEERKSLRVSVQKDKKRDKTKRAPPSGSQWNDFVVDAARRLKDSESSNSEISPWKGATARTLIALYEIMHERVYQVASELTAKQRQDAMIVASKLLNSKFGGDIVAMVEFMRWAWLDEERRWNNAKASPKRMVWNFLFSSSKYADWQAAIRRKPRTTIEKELAGG